MRPKLTYANVMSTLCFFLLLTGGAAYAASQLAKNTVGPKQLKKNSVTTAKVKKEAITAAKVKKGTLTGANVASGSLTGTQIDVATLGTVPNASHADTISQAEPPHKVGAPGEPPFQGGSENRGAVGPFRLQSVGFYKDHEGIVHLEGFARVGTTGSQPGEIFVLPPGFRPTAGTMLVFEQVFEGQVEVFGSNTSVGPTVFDGKVSGVPGRVASLDGITFRAES